MSDHKGESEAERGPGLAPVIPLFGDRGRPAPERTPAEHTAPDTDPRDGHDGSSSVEVAQSTGDGAGGGWHTSWLAADDAPDLELAGDDERRERVETAEAALLRKLRGRSLSIREARTQLVAHDLDEADIDGVIARFERHGYLDDAKLADQLIHTAVERKGQGRRVVAQALAQRGIPRDVVDAAMTEVPDDDAERAREFARHKARTMTDLDREVALRRLAGQLARRGYGAHALEAARQALDEAGGSGGGRSGVRFR